VRCGKPAMNGGSPGLPPLVSTQVRNLQQQAQLKRLIGINEIPKKGIDLFCSRSAGLNHIRTGLSIITAVVVCSAAAAGGSLEGHLPWLDLGEKLDSIRLEYEVPGLAAAVISADSVIWIDCFGIVDSNTSAPVTDSTLFRMASVAKSVEAVAIMKMIEEGRFGLDTQIDSLIPEIDVDNPWATTDPVKIVHLLEHSSGMEDIHHWEYFNVRHDPAISVLEYLEMSVKTRRLMWRPGTRMAYSSHGYGVLRYVMEKASGVAFNEYMNDSVLPSLGMNDSRFGISEDELTELAQGYAGQSVKWLPEYNGSLYSSVRDMAKFTSLFLCQGRIMGSQWLSESGVARMENPQTTTAARNGLAIGYGLGLRTRFMKGVKYLGHSGSIPGYTSIFAYYPEYAKGYILLMNTSGRSAFGPLREQIHEFLFRNVAPSVPSTPTMTGEELRQYEGYYHGSNPNLRIKAAGSVLMPSDIQVKVVSDTLWEIDSDGRRYHLIPVAPGYFRRPNQSEATVIFTRDDNGAEIMADPIYFDEYARDSGLTRQAYRFIAIACLVIALSSIVYWAVWLMVRLIARFKGKPIGAVELLARLVPVAAVTILVGAVIWLALGSDPAHLVETGLYNGATVFLFIATIVFPILAVVNLGIVYSFLRGKAGYISRIYLSIVATCLIIMAVFMAYWDLIGFKAWVY